MTRESELSYVAKECRCQDVRPWAANRLRADLAAEAAADRTPREGKHPMTNSPSDTKGSARERWLLRLFAVLRFLLIDAPNTLRALGGAHRWHGCSRTRDCRAHPHPDHVRALLKRRRVLFHECSPDCYIREVTR